ncbi:MAG: ComF family protein [Thermodesulfobacteriota bacterium]|nr:ComF family protein [Thermodesulfobacteriota bacterium]
MLLDVLLDFFFPTICFVCRKDIAPTQNVCKICSSHIKYISSPLCVQCGIPFLTKAGRDHFCGACLTSKIYFNKARAVGYYEGVLQEEIHQFKFNKKTFLAKHLGALMANYELDSFDLDSYDFIIPVPLHFKRLRERGFNQALYLSRYVGKRYDIPVDFKNLKRTRWRGPQVNLGKAERERNVNGAFVLYNKNRFRGKDVLLIDDVFTSGATVNECAKVLKKAGVSSVDVFTLSRAI